MSIRFRLLLSYVGMILIPIVIILLLSSAFSVFFSEEKEDIKNMINPMRGVAKYVETLKKMERKINLEILNREEDLVDPSYIKKLEDNLDEYFSGIVVRKNLNIVYVSKALDMKEAIQKLPKFKEEISKRWYIEDKHEFVIDAQNDFYLKDGSEVSLFIITNLDKAKKHFDYVRNQATIIIMLVLIFTTFILTCFVYRSIIRSIKKLKVAVNEIKKGNLDYEVKKHLNDEIGELSSILESMRKRLKQSLEMQKKYEENRKTLISNISHDLKTPLMSIKGYVEGIQDGVADTPEKINKYMNTIYEKSKDMEMLIEELFLFSKLDLEKVQFNFQKINIIEFLKYSVEDLSFDLEKLNGKIDLSYEENSIMVKTDIQKLKRVILNIVNNSIKYKSERPLHIQISVKKCDPFVIISIEDNGKGISKKDLPFVFDRFYRADPARNTSIKGSGLGLSISKQIIEKHEGQMWIESKEDEGTSIFFSLRLYREGEENEENIDY